jgi:osmotically-inducible protein OsmY
VGGNKWVWPVVDKYGWRMRQRLFLSILLLFALVAFGPVGCTKPQQERARDREKEAEGKLDRAAQKLKGYAGRLKQRAKVEMEQLKPSGERAEEKLRAADQTTRDAGARGKTETSRLALVARAKAALANEVGLKTLSDIGVESDGSTVTLTGRVARAVDKQRAEVAVASLSGVTRVVNRIEVDQESPKR